MERKYIGNIVTNYRPEKFPPFFNVCTGMDGIIEGVATMIIGLEQARRLIEGFSIITKRYNDDSLWWTYKKTERNYEFDVDMTEFYRFCFKRFFDSVSYHYIDLPKYRYNGIKRLIRWIQSPVPKLCFITRDSNFIFLYDEAKKTVFGLSLTLCEYMGVDKKKVLTKIRAIKHNRFIYDTSFVNGELRAIIGNNTHLILPLANILPTK